MLNRYPLWKYLMVIVVIAIGFLYAAPNLYGEDPALQVSASRGAEVKLETLDQVKKPSTRRRSRSSMRRSSTASS